MNTIKKIYFATIALAAPLGVLWEIVVLIADGPVKLSPAIEAYVWIGIILMLIDLWMLDISNDRKLWWTFVNAIFGKLKYATA